MSFARYPSLENRVVFISGGGTGIGAAMVEAFAGQGARVAFVDVAREESEALAEKLAGAAHRPLFLPCDVTDIREPGGGDGGDARATRADRRAYQQRRQRSAPSEPNRSAKPTGTARSRSI